MLAPIVLFAFNRPIHTFRLLNSLAKSKLAKDSLLFVYLDAPRTQNDSTKVDEVFKIISDVSGFKSIKIIRREVNYGLSKNIIEGVTDILVDFNKLIVLEDDLVVSENFLEYMNDSLNYYEEFKDVWHISGFTESISSINFDRSFFWRVMDCWGWATWRDRWDRFEKNTDLLLEKFTTDMIYSFNLNGSVNFWDQVILNKNNKIDTWAIYWYATIFLNDGLCLNPYVSYVSNTGFDGTGINCANHGGNDDSLPLNQAGRFYPPDIIKEDSEAVGMLIDFYSSKNRAKVSIKFYQACKRICKFFIRIF